MSKSKLSPAAVLQSRITELGIMLSQQDARTREVEKHRDGLYGELATARQEASAANKKLDESRQHFADLKEQLYDTEMANSRLRGVIERVHEQDRLGEPITETIIREAPTRAPATPDRAILRGVPHPDVAHIAGTRRRHWTSW